MMVPWQNQLKHLAGYRKDHLVTTKNVVLWVRNVVYFDAKDKKVYAHLEGGKKHEIGVSLSFLRKSYSEDLIQTHRYCLVAFHRIRGVSPRYPTSDETEEPILRQLHGQLGFREVEECELHLDGIERTVPVTSTYSEALKAALGVKSLQHLVPEIPRQKELRLIGIIDFGWRELDQLDPKDKKAVEAFREKWDVRLFDRKRMLSHFRQIGKNRLDKRRMLMNVVFQIWRWIQKGIEKPGTGNIRTLWYDIKGLLTYHSYKPSSGDVHIYYDVMQDLVEKHRLVRYQDFGFKDMNAIFRVIGKERPHLIVATEKGGQFTLVEQMAAEVGGTLICTRGEPGSIMLEYFADALLAVVDGKPLEIFCITDMNPAGVSIPKTLVRGLEWRGLPVKRVVQLVDMAAYTERQIMIHRDAMVRYRVQAGKIYPVDPKSMSRITKVRRWYEETLQDPRMRDERKAHEGGKLITIYSIESDVANEEVFIKRFRKAVKESL